MYAFKHLLRKARNGELRFPILAVFLLSVLWACQLAQNNKVEDTVSFDALYDSLSRFDSVVIVFKDPQGNLLDTVVKGKVDSHSKIRNLDVKGWDGGKAQIQIFGFDAGQLVYQVDKKYDGTSDQTDANIVVVVPNAAITSDIHELVMASGDSLKYPAISVGPPALSDKSVVWSSSNPDVLYADPDFIKALLPGSAILKAQLKVSPSTQLTLSVTVSPSNRAPESLAFDHDTLYLAADGSPGKLAVKASPSNASNAVTWSVEATTIAKVDSNGNVSGLSKGITKLIATSREKPSLTISGVVVVSDPVAIDKVRFKKNPITIYVGGIPADLAVDVSPPQAIQNVGLTVLESTLAVLNGSALKALAVGTAHVVAKSTADPAKSDTLIVSILDAGKIDSDTLKPLSPILTGPASTSLSPVWHWATGGGGGSGDFRYKLGDADFTQGATLSRDTSFTLKDGLASGTTYTLFVAERDLAGNWSDAAKLAIKYDLTKPVVTLTSPAFSGGTLYTNSASLNLSGTVTGPSPISSVAYAIGNGPATPITLSAGSWTLTGIALTEGIPANITITATDAVGNMGSLVVSMLMDNTPPAAPAFVLTPTTPTKAISGAWTWTAGADGATGSGLNGHFRYALNSGAWKDTTGLGMGNIVLSEGNNVLALQEQDRSGLWSASATSLVKVDLTAPSISILSHSNPASITTTHIAFTASASDSGSGTQSVTVAGQTAGNGVLTNSSGTWTSADLTLKGGANSLVVTATDQVGNSRNLTFTVNVNVPASVVLITDPPSNTITNADSIDVSYTIDGTSGKKRFGLVEGSNTLTVASPPNTSGAVGNDSVKVTRDATAPKAPTLSINASNTNGTATWTWTSNGDNTGGAGVKSPPAFRYSFNGGSTWAMTSSTSTTQTVEGVYALVVQEQDKAGNWSASSVTKAIAVDKTPPVVTIQTPNNYITNKASVSISYTEQDSTKASVSKTKSVSLPTDDGANTVTISSTADAAGNVGTASITVYRRSKVVFVKTSSAGTGDGSSWDNAAGGLESGLAKAGSDYEIWMSTGTYKTSSSSGMSIGKNTGIYGGFNPIGTAFDVTQRDSTLPNKTILAATTPDDTILKVNAVWNDPMPSLSNFVLNGVQISGLGSGQGAYGIIMNHTTHFEIRNCVFQQLNQNALNIILSQGLIYGCIFQYNTVSGHIIYVSLMESDMEGITFQKSIFQHNSFNESEGSAFFQVVYFFDGGHITFDNCSLLDSFSGSQPDEFHQLASGAPYPEAVVTFKNSIVTGGLGSILHSGTLNYTGLGNTPP